MLNTALQLLGRERARSWRYIRARSALPRRPRLRHRRMPARRRGRRRTSCSPCCANSMPRACDLIWVEEPPARPRVGRRARPPAARCRRLSRAARPPTVFRSIDECLRVNRLRCGALGAASLAAVLLASCGGGDRRSRRSCRRGCSPSATRPASITRADGRKYTVNAVRTTARATPRSTARPTRSGCQCWRRGYGLVLPRVQPATTRPSPAQPHLRRRAGAQGRPTWPRRSTQHLAADAFAEQRPGDACWSARNDVLAQYARYPDASEARAAAAELEAGRRGSAGQVNRIADAGGKVLIATVPDIGLTPFAIAEATANTTGRAALLTRLTERSTRSCVAKIINDGRAIGLRAGRRNGADRWSQLPARPTADVTVDGARAPARYGGTDRTLHHRQRCSRPRPTRRPTALDLSADAAHTAGQPRGSASTLHLVGRRSACTLMPRYGHAPASAVASHSARQRERAVHASEMPLTSRVGRSPACGTTAVVSVAAGSRQSSSQAASGRAGLAVRSIAAHCTSASSAGRAAFAFGWLTIATST